VEQVVRARGGFDPRGQIRLDLGVEIQKPAVKPAQSGGERVLALAGDDPLASVAVDVAEADVDGGE
jgi:hypothetical protein